MEEGSLAPRIYVRGDAVLERMCDEVSVESIMRKDEVLQRAIADAHAALGDFRQKNGFGRAIAAPQVGHAIRMIALHLNGEKRTMCNPVITEASEEKFTLWDDCLSFPDLMAHVSRHRQISVKFVNEEGREEHWEHLDQAVSELLQHEIDHLNGVLALDIATSPRGGEVPAVVSRADWLANKQYYNNLVDYSIA